MKIARVSKRAVRNKTLIFFNVLQRYQRCKNKVKRSYE
jgi:hypothetical protein